MIFDPSEYYAISAYERAMTEPYRYNPHSPAHVNNEARDEARKRGEDVTPEDVKQTQHEEGATAARSTSRPAE